MPNIKNINNHIFIMRSTSVTYQVPYAIPTGLNVCTNYSILICIVKKPCLENEDSKCANMYRKKKPASKMRIRNARICIVKINLPRKWGFEMRESRQPMTAPVIRHFLWTWKFKKRQLSKIASLFYYEICQETVRKIREKQIGAEIRETGSSQFQSQRPT